MIEITFDGAKVITAHSGDHVIRTDQPVNKGGGDTAPSPFDLYLASIGTCTGIYVKSFCDNRKIPAENIKILEHVEYNSETQLPDSIKLEIKLPPDFPGKYRESVIKVANLCLVKKSIASPPEFLVTTSY